MSDLPGGRVRVHYLPSFHGVGMLSGTIFDPPRSGKAACGKSYWPYQLTSDPAKVECKLCRKKVQRAA